MRDVDRASAMYTAVLGAERCKGESAAGWSDGEAEIHLERPSARFAFEHGAAIHPSLNGHFALRVDDIDAIEARLRQRDLPFVTDGAGGAEKRLLFFDQDMNVVEVRELLAVAPVVGATSSWLLHHVNIPVNDVRAAASFYGDVFGMEEISFGSDRITPVISARFCDGAREIHMSQPHPDMTFDGWRVHPTLRGHVAFTVPDIADVETRLAGCGVRVDNRGASGLQGFRQIYFYDTELNAVEINERA